MHLERNKQTSRDVISAVIQQLEVVKIKNPFFKALSVSSDLGVYNLYSISSSKKNLLTIKQRDIKETYKNTQLTKA